MSAGVKGGLGAADMTSGSFIMPVGGSVRTGNADKLVELITIWRSSPPLSSALWEVEVGGSELSMSADVMGRAAKAGDPAKSSLIKFV